MDDHGWIAILGTGGGATAIAFFAWIRGRVKDGLSGVDFWSISGRKLLKRAEEAEADRAVVEKSLERERACRKCAEERADEYQERLISKMDQWQLKLEGQVDAISRRAEWDNTVPDIAPSEDLPTFDPTARSPHDP